jgi:integrase
VAASFDEDFLRGFLHRYAEDTDPGKRLDFISYHQYRHAADPAAVGAEKQRVRGWPNHWVDNIAAPFVRPNTLAGYRVAVRVHLIPGLGGHRLDRLQPEHLEKLYVRMMRNGSAAGTAHQAHRTIRTALGEAVRRGYLTRNPAALAKAPRLTEEEIEPYSIEDVRRILAAAAHSRNSARWAVALALGLRQGEALG